MSHFGHRIVGVQAAEESAKKEVGGSAFGPRVKDLPGAGRGVPVGTPAPGRKAAAPKNVAVPEGATDTGLSVDQFLAVLDENPAFLDTMLTQELERPDGPRRPCLQKARAIAVAMEDHETIADIDVALASIEPESSNTGNKGEQKPAAVDWSTKDWHDVVAEAKRRGIKTGGKKKAALIAALNAGEPAAA